MKVPPQIIEIPSNVFPPEEYEEDCPRVRQENFAEIIQEQHNALNCETAKNKAQREYRQEIKDKETPSPTDSR